LNQLIVLGFAEALAQNEEKGNADTSRVLVILARALSAHTFS